MYVFMHGYALMLAIQHTSMYDRAVTFFPGTSKMHVYTYYASAVACNRVYSVLKPKVLLDNRFH